MPTTTKSTSTINHIKDLKPDPNQARRHTARNIGIIADAMQAVGAARSVVIDENDVILAGHGAIDAAAQAGITNLQVVEGDGQTVIAVRRRGLTPAQKIRLALDDNRSSELSFWDAEALQQLQSAGTDLSHLWNADELKEMFDIVPDFQAVGEDEQGRLDEKTPVTCPECGHVFTP